MRFGVMTVFTAKVMPAAEMNSAATGDGGSIGDVPAVVTSEALSSESGRAAFWSGVASGAIAGGGSVRVLVPRAAAPAIVQQSLPPSGHGSETLLLDDEAGPTGDGGSDIAVVDGADNTAALQLSVELDRESRTLGAVLGERSSAQHNSAAARAPPSLPGDASALHDFVRDDSAMDDGGVSAGRTVATPQLRKVDNELLYAAEIGDAARVSKLMENSGAMRPDVRAAHRSHGATALHLAAGAADEDAALAICELLLDAGADVSARAANGATALHWAAGGGNVRVIRRLVAAGCDPSVVSYTWRRQVFGKDSGMTPAHWAAQSGHADAVRELASLAAESIGALDERGRSPREVAVGEGHHRVADDLLKLESEEYVLLQINVEQQFGRPL